MDSSLSLSSSSSSSSLSSSSSSWRDALRNLFGEIIEWRIMFADEVRFQWSELHLLVVRDYILKFDLKNSNCRTLRAARHFTEPLWYRSRHSVRNYRTKVAFFTREFQEFFVVPRPRGVAVENGDVLAAFINFLLQLLSHKPDLIDPVEEQVDSLEKDLRFLFTVVGDASLLRGEDENLLAEFGEAVNGAGSLVHSLIFSTDPSFNAMDNLDALSDRIGLLNDNIIQLSAFTHNYTTPKMADVDSLFIVDSFLHDLNDLLDRNEGLGVSVKNQIELLRLRLISCLSLLKSIKRTPQSGRVEEAETRIRDVAYEAEYLIMSFVVGDAPLQYFTNRLLHVLHKIELVEIGLLDVNQEQGEVDSFEQPVRVAKETYEAGVVGFEETAMHILEQLLGEQQRLQTILIYGMGGLGKTTIAKELYNRPLVKECFVICAWCTVSQTYSRRNVLVDILLSVRGEFDKARILNMEEELLSILVHQSLCGRRYLIVLDDVWDSKIWDGLMPLFPNRDEGSRILITSRYREVAPHGSINIPLPSLTDDQCWELLKKKVFLQAESCPPELEAIGKEIAINCGRLPLSVVVVAGILSSLEKSKNVWKNVLGDLVSFMYGGGTELMQILGLGYKHLPEQFRPCFLYFGAFPEDTEIPARKLMRLWIAEGFVREEPGKSSESVAEEYLMELIDRSLIIVAKRRTNGGVKACLIHDLLREFCLKICLGEYFLQFVNKNCSLNEKGHRLISLERSVTPFGQHVRSVHGYLLDSTFYVRNMRLLRVLDFKKMLNQASLIGIEYLIHLRYLVINELSTLLANLINLEYLRVENNGTVRIPSEILKMVKLKLLQINREAIFEDNCSSSHISNLEFVSNIIIRKQKDEEILKSSPRIRKLKCTVEGKGEDRRLDLKMFSKLESLNVKFSRHVKGEINYPVNVVKLTLAGMGLPWAKMSIIGRLPYLKVLKLGCRAFVGETWKTDGGEFPQLSFLKMEMLDLAEWNVGSLEDFPRLERLVLYQCRKLRQIPTEIGDIPTLDLIEVQLCSNALERSAVQIQEEQRELGNYELRVIFTHLTPNHMDFQREMMSLEASSAMFDDGIGSSLNFLQLEGSSSNSSRP